MSATLRLAEQLLSCPSVTPQDAGCQSLIAQRLAALGFACETITRGPVGFEVTNLWAKRPGVPANTARAASKSVAQLAGVKTLVFAGHTDVVPPGPLNEWGCAPFVPSYREGRLYARGASDMKTSLAAFVVAIEEFLSNQADPALAIAVLLTSDEEGPAIDGTVAVCDTLKARGETLDYCIVGEPTSVERTGDTIKNGRRGSMNGKLTVKGVQGHIAYPQLANNPIHRLAPALAELVGMEWDRGNDFFQPTTWQVSNLHSGTGASNVIPGAVVVDFNFRFSTESSPESLQSRLTRVLERHELEYDLLWTISGLPFLTRPGALVDAVRAAIYSETGMQAALSTTGGTSDGRFLAQICPEVIELGPPNASIHKVNEFVAVADVEPLKNIYRRVLENLDELARA
jgi:succinyl-diaminopimelate desuccinylase